MQFMLKKPFDTSASYGEKMFKFASWRINENLISRIEGRESLGSIQAAKTNYLKVSLQEHRKMLEDKQIAQCYWNTGCHREDNIEKRVPQVLHYSKVLVPYTTGNGIHAC